jgi:alkylation response protein AidB-like acyl-CoA dehydrogenase
MPSPDDHLGAARRIADGLLFPDAMTVERTGILPLRHLEALADAGLYGVAAPVADGGVGTGDQATMAGLVETLAAGCLTTAFVWIQHHGTVAAVAAGSVEMRDRWLGPLCRGELRAGIGLAGLRTEPALRVRRIDDGFELDGSCPWVTGWGSITTIGIAARDEDDVVHHLLVDAVTSPTLTARPHELVAVQASGTVTVEFTHHVVAADRLLTTRPFADWRSGDAHGSTMNGFLAIGSARRSCRLLGPSDLDAEVDAARAGLLGATGDAIGPARAAASELALRAAAALAVRTGARSVLLDQHAQRLVREAAFLLVFGSRPGMRDALLDGLGAGGLSAAG